VPLLNNLSSDSSRVQYEQKGDDFNAAKLCNGFHKYWSVSLRFQISITGTVVNMPRLEKRSPLIIVGDDTTEFHDLTIGGVSRANTTQY